MSRRKRTPPPCPKCGSTDTYLCRYGHTLDMPGHDCIVGTEPKWACNACQHGWGVVDEDNFREDG
jgi:hypothetical protein